MSLCRPMDNHRAMKDTDNVVVTNVWSVPSWETNWRLAVIVRKAAVVLTRTFPLREPKFTFIQFPRNDRPVSASVLQRELGRGCVIGSDYFVRQARTLLQMAKIVRDPRVSARLASKAAEFEARKNERPSDRNPIHAPNPHGSDANENA